MQLEEACVVEVTKLMKYVEIKEDLLVQIVTAHQHSTNSTMLQPDRILKRELKRGKRQITDIITEKTKIGNGKGCMDNFYIT
jgi:hypothetical protein